MEQNERGKQHSKAQFPPTWRGRLLSTATAQWKTPNAREEIDALVDQPNGTDKGFGFDKDFVMKACLVLTEEITNIRFKVHNLNASNTKKIETNWEIGGM